MAVFDHRPHGVIVEPAMAQQVGEVLNRHWRTPTASPEDTRSVQVIRGLVLDCCQQWGIGHGGKVIFF